MSQYPEQIYRHTTASVLRHWRERYGRYRIMGTRCKDCGDLHFPRRTVCPKCNQRNLEPYEHPHTGKIATCYISDSPWGALLGLGEQVPRVPAVVMLDNGVPILTEIIDADPTTVKPGMRVEMVLRKLRRESNSNWLYGYKFVLSN
jgi:uncharacterized OB-fold protein